MFRGWMHIDIDFLLSLRGNMEREIWEILLENFYFHAQSEREKRI